MLEYEIIKNPRIRRVNVFVNEITYRAHHIHSETEIILLLEGNGEITISENNIPIKKDDIILINGTQSHEIKARDEKLLCLIIQVSRSFLNEYCNDLRNIRFQDNLITDDRYARELLLQLGKTYFENDENQQLKCICLLTNLLCHLLETVKYDKIPETVFERQQKKEQRIDRILTYIENRHQEQLRLSDIAEKENITVTHLSHLFKDACGIGFQDYLSELRFEHSLTLMANEKMSLSDIAYESGFSELKYMNAMYLKTFKVSASQFRQNIPQVYLSRKKDAFTLENILDPEDSLNILRKISL